jgi:ubiquinone/menaquinone biosynthesis C-methylase UbiE
MGDNIMSAIADSYGPATAETYDQMADELFWAYRETLLAITMDVLARKSKLSCSSKNRPAVRKVLDCGFGTGTLMVTIKKYLDVESFFGLDLSEDMAKVAEEKIGQNIEIFIGKIEDIETIIQEKEFDCILSSFAMHHVEDVLKKKVIASLYNMLAPEGVLVIGDRIATKYEYEWTISSKVLAWHFINGASRLKGECNERIDEIIAEMQRQFDSDGDKPATIESHSEWFKSAGFSEVYSPFHSFGIGVISGIKKE